MTAPAMINQDRARELHAAGWPCGMENTAAPCLKAGGCTCHAAATKLFLTAQTFSPEQSERFLNMRCEPDHGPDGRGLGIIILATVILAVAAVAYRFFGG